jgi:hypothetical protein
MSQIYRTKIHGQIFESRNLQDLLARAVLEKRQMDRKMLVLGGLRSGMARCSGRLSSVDAPSGSYQKAG